jgi:hypothetical protein
VRPPPSSAATHLLGPPHTAGRPPRSTSLPTTDSLGCVDGICHDDTLNITQTDGLTDSERSRLVDRSMARVEVLRQAEFNRTVPVRVMTPTNFSQDRFATNDTKSRFNRWNDQVWKALFVVARTTAASRRSRTRSAARSAGSIARRATRSWSSPGTLTTRA